jgi:hypothetical protein
VSNRLAARRYAKALVQIGEAQGNLMLLQHELGEVTALVKGNPDLTRLVVNPLVVPRRKAVVFEMVLRQAGVSVTLCNFFKVVAENARLGLVHEIEAAFRELVDERAAPQRRPVQGPPGLPVRPHREVHPPRVRPGPRAPRGREGPGGLHRARRLPPGPPAAPEAAAPQRLNPA